MSNKLQLFVQLMCIVAGLYNLSSRHLLAQSQEWKHQNNVFKDVALVSFMLTLNRFRTVDFEQVNAGWTASAPMRSDDSSTTNIFPGSIRRYKSYFPYHFLRASSVVPNSIYGKNINIATKLELTTKDYEHWTYVGFHRLLSSTSFFWELQYLKYHISNIF